MSTAAPSFTVSCSKPDCSWSGSPAEAPGHPCPTPAGEAPNAANGAGTITATLKAVPDAEETILDRDSDPQTRDDLIGWLTDFGEYDDAGVPQDEKTATLTARLDALGDEPGDAEPELDHETADLAAGETQTLEEVASEDDQPEIDPELTANLGADEEVIVDLAAYGGVPWPISIARALEGQTGIASYRWLVVFTPADPESGEAELVGRGKTMSDATEILERVQEAGEHTGGLEVMKTQDVLDLAFQIRENALEVEPQREQTAPEPDETVEQDVPPDEVEKQEPDDDEPTAAAGDALFDSSAYEREDLAIQKVDGQAIDRIAVAFSGEIMLDRTSVEDVALYNRLTLNNEVDLIVTGRVSGTGAKGATNREGDLDVVVGKRTLKIETVKSPAGSS